jgi:hypothetical protein
MTNSLFSSLEINALNAMAIHFFIIITIIIIISVSTVLLRILVASHRKFRNLIKTLGKTPLNEWLARRKGLYLRKTTLHRNTKTNIYASSGILTHDPSNQRGRSYFTY